MSEEDGWNKVDTNTPKGVPLLTKLDDERGPRNQTTLVYENNLWFTPDRAMYVYYTPTHWKFP